MCGEGPGRARAAGLRKEKGSWRSLMPPQPGREEGAAWILMGAPLTLILTLFGVATPLAPYCLPQVWGHHS